MNKEKLFLLDAYALIFRGYYAFIKNPRINSKGLDTSAVLGFTNSLFDLINREKPKYIAVAFDKGGSKNRRMLFNEYKANRKETPEAIKISVPIIQNLLKSLNIPILELEGYEADDIIGTIAKQAEKESFQVFMVTPDKDFAQLVSKNIFMYKPSRLGNGIEIWGIDEVKKKFEVDDPLQVIDYLGMMGDSSDNIPGLPGVGDKTAKKFISTYGNIENLLKNTGELKGKLKERIENNKHLGILSKKLATIQLDVPVKFNSNDCIFGELNDKSVLKIFEELEFNRLIETYKKKISSSRSKENNKKDIQNIDLFNQFSEINEDSEYATIETKPHLYQLVSSYFELKLLMQLLESQDSVCFDTETTSLNEMEAELIGISFSWKYETGYFVLIPNDSEGKNLFIETLKKFFENDNIEKIGQNIKYDFKVLKKYGIELKGKLFDTMLAHYLINPDARHNLETLSKNYLGYKMIPITKLIGKKGKNQLSMIDVPIEDLCEYAVEDADITFQLKNIFEKKLYKLNQKSLFEQVEIPLINVLSYMELEGINIDVSFLNNFSSVLDNDIYKLENKIFEKVGVKFNLASPKQLGVVLFEKLKIVDNPKKTKTGQYSTSEEVLSNLSKKNLIVVDILDWRSLIKLQNTYVKALPLQVNTLTKRIHTQFNQAVAATGRLSSNHPNLQNIPIRTVEGKQVRKAFCAVDNNHVILAADYSQIELRIIASLANELNMINAFNNGEDIHSSTASKIFGMAVEKISKEQRSQAKTVNFGIIYGVSAFGLSSQTSLTRKESKIIIDAYYESYPGLKSFINKQINFARENGYVETILGRRRYLRDINSRNSIVRSASERNAVNAPIQGSAADIIKLAMININKRLKNEKLETKMMLQVHDELVFETPKKEIEKCVKIIRHEMENVFDLRVKLKVDINYGNNWLEAH
ncbi:MAG: DNA polymerase I [Bacteroidota bacterium]|nr:DNA polymerase I [Bacteroidota bacterium]